MMGLTVDEFTVDEFVMSHPLADVSEGAWRETCVARNAVAPTCLLVRGAQPRSGTCTECGGPLRPVRLSDRFLRSVDSGFIPRSS